MNLPKSYFSGSRLNYRAPCTSSEGRLCNIFKELHLWNEFFWPVGVQLRELSPGQLSLVELLDGSYSLVKKQRERSTVILIHLLTHHRCVVSLDLSDDFFFVYPTEDKAKTHMSSPAQEFEPQKAQVEPRAFHPVHVAELSRNAPAPDPATRPRARLRAFRPHIPGGPVGVSGEHPIPDDAHHDRIVRE
ncbi:hypothetical protein MTO96_032558 [Rhipicephalus appendiculatus]